MSLHQSISHLTKQEQTDLRQIVKTLSATVHPLLLYCYGMRSSLQLHRSCFTQKRKSNSGHSVYDLLMVLHDKEALTDEAVTLVAKRMIGSSTNTNILVHRFSFMKTQLLEMNFFFTWVHRSAILLINRDNSFAQLPPSNKKTDILPASQQTHIAIKEKLDKAKSLLTSVQAQWTLQPYGATLGLIKEAATEIMKALLVTGLGYDPIGCSIEMMMKLSENFTTIPADSFPANTAEEKNIYSLLTTEMAPEKINHTTMMVLLNRVKELKQKVNDYRFSNQTLLKLPQCLSVSDIKFSQQQQGQT
ncbi:MAG TPA: hypothetical protein VHD35_18550 [Chitinophagaceae bacterium]|jgi:hypothetical protein|nr:hypothetical protein [Chitinophagaceae bacterium]